MSDQITFSIKGRVACVGMNRLDKKNALTAAMYAGLVDALQKADADATVRVILIHGSNECFTAGNDLHDFTKADPASENTPVVQFLRSLCTTRKPLVAAVAGPAVGIGTTMLLHCDLVYADPGTRFQLPFVTLGLCPEAASSLLLAQIVGHQRAAELLLFGDPFDATKAHSFGLVNEIAPAGGVIETATEKSRALAERPGDSLTLTKKLMKQGNAKLVAEVLTDELIHFRERLKSPEAQEAFRSFFERRKPDFSNFA